MSEPYLGWTAAGGRRHLALMEGQKPRLEVVWKPAFEETSFYLDDEHVATVLKRDLKDGRILPLGDGSQLETRLRRDFFGFSLELARDGRPLPGSPGALKPPHKLAYRILYLLAGLSLGGSLVFFSRPEAELGRIHPGWVLASGFVYLVCGMYTHRRSATALVLGIVFFTGDGVRSVVEGILAGEALPWAGLFVRVVLLLGLIRGVRSTRLLPPKERSVPPWVELLLPLWPLEPGGGEKSPPP